MQYLSTLNAGIGGPQIDIDTSNWWDSGWGSEDTSDYVPEEDNGYEYDSWGESSDNSWGASEETEVWGWDDWGRKRRSAAVAMDKAEVLAEAIESFVFPQFKDMLPMNTRDRRSFSMDWMTGQQPADHDQAERIKNEMEDLQCFKSMMNNDAQADYEEGEEVEEEGTEEEEDPYVRVRQQRKETDHVGIRNWVQDK